MNTARFGEANVGALVGAIVGAIGGLFALGLVRAIVNHDVRLLFGTPILGLICWLVSGLVGWFIGGQVGPLLAGKKQSRRTEAVGGALGGLIPVLLIALWGWYMIAPR